MCSYFFTTRIFLITIPVNPRKAMFIFCLTFQTITWESTYVQWKKFVFSFVKCCMVLTPVMFITAYRYKLKKDILTFYWKLFGIVCKKRGVFGTVCLHFLVIIINSRYTFKIPDFPCSFVRCSSSMIIDNLPFRR